MGPSAGRGDAIQHAWRLAPLTGAALAEPLSAMNAVALIVCVAVLLTVQILLIRRTLDARRQVDVEPPGESQARELVWTILPAVLLLALVVYSLRYARVI